MSTLKEKLEAIRAILSNATSYLDSGLDEDMARQYLAERALYGGLRPALAAIEDLISHGTAPDLQGEIDRHSTTYTVMYPGPQFQRVVDMVTDDCRPFVRAAVEATFVNYIEAQRTVADDAVKERDL